MNSVVYSGRVSVTRGTCVISVSIFISAVKFFFSRNNIGHLSGIINSKQSRGSLTVVKTRKYNMMMTGEINRSMYIKTCSAV